MDVGVFVSAILGSGGFFALIQYFVSRHDNRDERLKRIEEKIDSSLEKSDRNELATTRLQLLFVIQTQPHNRDTILKTAQRYFIELDGNGEAWDVFKRWAEDNQVDYGYYKTLLKHEKERKK